MELSASFLGPETWGVGRSKLFSNTTRLLQIIVLHGVLIEKIVVLRKHLNTQFLCSLYCSLSYNGPPPPPFFLEGAPLG